MSHELRTPLNAIVGYVDLLELGLHGPLTDAQRQDLARLKQNQGTLLRLIQDVLDFAKIESGRVLFETNDIPLNELLHSLEVFVAPMLAKKRLEYHFAPCEPPLTVRGDREKVQQIMLNLLSNAAKFTDRGRIDVCCERRGDSVEIQARDTGRGIQPEQIESIFEAFVQGEQHLTRTAEGTGLGLAISRRFARAMGGDVRVTSEPGRGSTFILALPLGLDRDD